MVLNGQDHRVPGVEEWRDDRGAEEGDLTIRIIAETGKQGCITLNVLCMFVHVCTCFNER